MKRNLMISALGLCLATSCDSGPETGSSGPPPTSLLLVTIDTLRADHLGCYGYERAGTPIMDGLAASGVRFKSANTVVPLTFPSHTSIMTGTIPPYHGVRDNASHRALPELVTLAEVLKAAGFHTGAFTAAFVLDPIYGLDQGFDFYGATPQRMPEPQSEFEERSAAEVNLEATTWLKSLKDDRPFFMWVHYFEPHLPYPAKNALPARFKSRPYDAEINLADQRLGELLKSMEQQGRREETLVVLTSDHGESMNEHGEETHSYFTYEATLHVPLIFQHNSLERGFISETRVSLIDIMPTVLEVFNLSPGDLPAPAASLVPDLHGQTSEPRPVYFESQAPLLSYGWSPIYGVSIGDTKYIRLPKSELYALTTDPGELNNIYAEDSADVQRLSAALDVLFEENDSPERGAAAQRELSGDERQKLANLGYVGTAGASSPEITLADPKDGIERIRKESEVRHFLEHGELQDAERALGELLREDPKNPIFNAHFGLLMMNYKRHGDAVPFLIKSIDGGLDNATNYSNLGTCYFKIRSFEK
ncbi:MAG: choline-sulfatase, partial [Candidatus Paceibacteria bacterium]